MVEYSYPGQLLFIIERDLCMKWLAVGDIIIVREKVETEWAYEHTDVICITGLPDVGFTRYCFEPVKKLIKDKIKSIII